jgi:3-oxoacyl-[acyl-carrier protein] reductase
VATEFSGKTALITGASRGIGAATALAFARLGVARLILQYNTFTSGAEETAESARRSGAEVETVAADFSRTEGIHTFLEYLHSRKPPVDILVNNAGSLVERARLTEMREDIYDRVMDLNVKSAWMVTQAVAPGMIARKSGFVIFVSSIAARNGGGPGATMYAAAKAAVACMTKGVAKELAAYGIRVNAVSPGTVDNNFHAQFSTRQMLDTVIAATPAARLGDNEEVADTIVFLCSRPARFIYGQTIEINGGMYMV